MKKELVISAYQRPYTQWTKYINPDVKIIVYRKGIDFKNPDEIFLEKNVGQDVHTFFNHILTQYDNLADYTFFSQDFPFDHVSRYIEIINDNPTYWADCCNMKIEGYYAFSSATALHWDPSFPPEFYKEAYTGKTLICKQDGSPHHRPYELNLNTLWTQLFKGTPPTHFEFVPSGHFCASRDQLRIRSKEFYAKLINLLETRPLCPYEVERLEPYIINPAFESIL